MLWSSSLRTRKRATCNYRFCWHFKCNCEVGRSSRILVLIYENPCLRQSFYCVFRTDLSSDTILSVYHTRISKLDRVLWNDYWFRICHSHCDRKYSSAIWGVFHGQGHVPHTWQENSVYYVSASLSCCVVVMVNTACERRWFLMCTVMACFRLTTLGSKKVQHLTGSNFVQS